MTGSESVVSLPSNKRATWENGQAKDETALRCANTVNERSLTRQSRLTEKGGSGDYLTTAV